MASRWLDVLLGVLLLPPLLFAYSAAVGLGLHRHGHPMAVSLAATISVLLPAVMVAWVAERRLRSFLVSALIWCAMMWLLMPVYFPGERRGAVATGLALWFGGAGERVASSIPDEPELSEPELDVALARVEPELPPGIPVADHEIVLPYEGEGRNLAIPVVFSNGGREVELMMMLDTGATYTTLSLEVLAELGIVPGPEDPVLDMHTANGKRTSSIHSLDHVWLGDQRIDGIAVSTCDECASSQVAGLLGLNVAGGFNVWIDADRREVTFSRRDTVDRKLDAKPWVDLDARFSRYPGGRVEVSVSLENRGGRDLDQVLAQVRCADKVWVVDLGAVQAGDMVNRKKRLPAHEACAAYQIALDQVLF